ncbi:unnamed protein product, partial [Larinioides sclopetarius]
MRWAAAASTTGTRPRLRQRTGKMSRPTPPAQKTLLSLEMLPLNDISGNRVTPIKFAHLT